MKQRKRKKITTNITSILTSLRPSHQSFNLTDMDSEADSIYE
ncbi:366_t:CDS:2, partial [Dentiscutata heterogama]